MTPRSRQQIYGDELRARMASRIQTASKRMMVDLPDKQIERAIAYSELLLKWNQTSNLTAIRNLEDIVDKHILDCLAIVNHVQGSKIIDLGSGAGFPGIALALARPDWKVMLVDSKAKKIQFLRHAVACLGFVNVQVLHQRIQDIATGELFDTAVARSLGSLKAIADLAWPLIASDGRIIAMKGQLPVAEIAALESPCRLTVRKLNVPFLDSERHCIILRSVS